MRRSNLPYDYVPGFRENRLLLDYIRGEEKTLSFLPPLLRGEEEMKGRAERLRSRDFPRELLADRLVQYNREMGAGEATLSGIEEIRRGAMVVVTGQQPGLLGGPLYTVLKAMTACLLARHAEEKGLGRTVPLFWCASEDHDLAEANRLEILDGPRPGRLHLDVEDRGACLSDYDIDPLGPALLGRLAASLQPTEFTGPLLDRVSSWMKGGFGGWFSRMMLSLFADWGLALIEPGRIRDLSAPFVEREIREPQATGVAIREAGRALQVGGYAPALTGDEGPGVFVIRDGVRRRIRAEAGMLVLKDGSPLDQDALLEEIRESPDRFSTGVAVRPVVQDGLFPVLASVVGPSEVSYLAQLLGVYDRHGVERPPILPRISSSLVEGKVERVLRRLSISREQVFQMEGDLLGEGPAEDAEFPRARSGVEAALQRLGETLPDGVRSGFPRVEKRIRRELDRVQGKVEEANRRAKGLGEEQIKRVRNGMVPFGRLQERVWSILPFLNRYGPELIGEMAGSVELFSFEHQWLYLASPRQAATAGVGPGELAP